MKKISATLKYKFDSEGDVQIFAFHKTKQEWVNVASCHPSCLDHIKKAGNLKTVVEQEIPIVFNRQLFTFNS
jgi:hypothetical protein